jgi:hypothetical protein
LDPKSAWATAYLLNTAFASEYLAIRPSLTPAALRTAASRDLWVKARFALSSFAAKGQDFPEAALLDRLLTEHAAILAATPGFATLSAAVIQAGEADTLSRADPKVQAGLVAVAGALSTAAARQQWERLIPAYGLPSPSCPLDYQAVKTFAARQKAMQVDTASVAPRQLLDPLAKWSLPQVQCLVFTLMASSPALKATEGFEPLPLMRSLSESSSPLARDASMRALFAVRQMQLGNLAETLAVLMDLGDMEDGYRLPYELVQRVFSLKQKGGGAVALQGI